MLQNDGCGAAVTAADNMCAANWLLWACVVEQCCLGALSSACVHHQAPSLQGSVKCVLPRMPAVHGAPFGPPGVCCRVHTRLMEG